MKAAQKLRGRARARGRGRNGQSVHRKLRKFGAVSFPIRLAVFLGRGRALMKLHIFKTTQIKVKGLWEWPPATITHPGNRG
ncbi:hypothetical protein D1AOALGA4SA_1394 [Olavius algarvensis Delta 1 endosymbiont]|nr:hypothetical protein D1AOALGA4SA_1394 [Olavius algarvensis Delta 1 endosymbiont]